MSFMETAIAAANHSGDVLLNYLGKIKHIEEKAFPGDLVTEADHQSEKVILNFISERYPKHAFLAEESGEIGKQDNFVWVIDPLDGTTNFTHQYPFFCISIALYHKGKPYLGVIYDPLRDECFYCEKGQGSYLNNHKVQVSNNEMLNDSLLATGFAYDRNTRLDNNYKEFCHITSLSQGVRRSGSAALDLAYVACGRLDGFWEQGLSPWDMAAGELLIREAGGKVTAYGAGPFVLDAKQIVATNGKVHDELVYELQSID